MWSNQYVKERFWELDKKRRMEIGKKYQHANQEREAWVKDFYENRRFLIKYTNIKYEKASLRGKRNKAYTKRFHTGKNLFVEYDVHISRQHYLYGKISIGNDVQLAKHTFIDFTGEVVIENNVTLSDGVVIESHSHNFIPGDNSHHATPTKVVIEEGVWVGQKSIICESCKRIGRYSQIGAGSVVRTSVPPYAIVVGNPAKVVGFLLNPDEMVSFEENRFSVDQKTYFEKYTKLYDKLFVERNISNKEYLKI